MVFKNLFQSIEKGVGIGIGLLIVAAFAFGVYAFVEPSTGPSSDFYFDPESPITSNTTLEFVGYSATTDGNVGGIIGGNADCDTAYEGSRWMTYGDFLRISHLYNYTYEVWIYDAVTTQGSTLYTADGSVILGSTSYPAETCATYSSTSGTGVTLATDGYMDSESCSSSFRLACVRGQ